MPMGATALSKLVSVNIDSALIFISRSFNLVQESPEFPYQAHSQTGVLHVLAGALKLSSLVHPQSQFSLPAIEA